MPSLAELMNARLAQPAPAPDKLYPTGPSYIRAPPQSPEDQRLLQDPAFREQYRAWVMSQGPGAADWATPTGYLESLNRQGGSGPTTPTGPTLSPGGSPTFDEGLGTDWFAQQGALGLPGRGTWGSPGSEDWRAPGGSGMPGGRMSNADAQAFFDQLFPGGTVSPEDLAAHRAELEAAGFTLNPNAAGRITDLTLPSGDTVDPIYGAGTGENRKQWLVHAAGAGGGMGAGGIGAGLENTPGYQFRLGEGLKALERSAAARGTLLTGGTLKGLQRYAQDVASTEYGNRVNQLQNLSQLGLGAAGTQANLGSNYAANAGNLLSNQATNQTNLLTDRGNAQAAGTLGGANAVNQGLGGATNLAQMYYLSRLFGGGR